MYLRRLFAIASPLAIIIALLFTVEAGAPPRRRVLAVLPVNVQIRWW